MHKNHKQSARHSVENEGPMENLANGRHRGRLGTERIYPEPVLDDVPLYKGKMSANEARHILGYSPHDIHSVKSQHGPENLGNSPQLGEGPYKGHTQTVIPKRHLK